MNGKLKRILRGTVRIHAGFAVVRIHSLGRVWPKKMDVDPIESAEKRLRR